MTLAKRLLLALGIVLVLTALRSLRGTDDGDGATATTTVATDG